MNSYAQKQAYMQRQTGLPVCRADGKGVTWDLPAVIQGSRFNGGALGENLRPMVTDSFYSW